MALSPQTEADVKNFLGGSALRAAQPPPAHADMADEIRLQASKASEPALKVMAKAILEMNEAIKRLEERR